MPYLARVDLFKALPFIQDRYLEKKPQLTKEQLEGQTEHSYQSYYATYTGKTDAPLRNKQINLITKLAVIDDPIAGVSEAQKVVGRYQFMIGILLCVKEQIKNPSWLPKFNYGDLSKVIEEFLNYSDHNQMDDNTAELCLKKVIHADIIHINNELALQHKEMISNGEFNAIKAIARKIIPTDSNNYAHPVASTLSRAGRVICRPIGIALGMVLFDMVGKSAVTTPLKLVLTSTFSYALGAVNPSYGPMLFAGRSAERAINITCQATGAMIGAEIAARLGEASGALTGLSIEIAYAATCRLIEHLRRLMALIEENEALSFNLNLLTGELVLLDRDGLEMSIQQVLQSNQSAPLNLEENEEIERVTQTLLTLSPEELNKLLQIVEESKQKVISQVILADNDGSLDPIHEEKAVELTS
jgi:hypothetical protein